MGDEGRAHLPESSQIHFALCKRLFNANLYEQWTLARDLVAIMRGLTGILCSAFFFYKTISERGLCSLPFMMLLSFEPVTFPVQVAPLCPLGVFSAFTPLYFAYSKTSLSMMPKYAIRLDWWQCFSIKFDGRRSD